MALVWPFISHSQSSFPCGSDHMRRVRIAQDSSILIKEHLLEQFTQQFVNQESSNRTNQVYTIPLVFHILHQKGPENISDAQIHDAVAILNRDFRKLNADTSQIVAGFDTLAEDAKIEFRLATIDPLGNCTNGIDRIYSPETYVGDDGSKLNQWPRNKYLNIWVVSQMENGVAGYAYYPSAVDAGLMAMVDGVIILHNYIGSIGTSNPYRSRALTHEVGHWMNLQHPWGNNNDPGVACGDDQVNDTPITKGWTTCNLGGNVCNPGIVENVQNYMDYSYCSLMFTKGQVLRMQAALESTEAGRNNLWSAQNLLATGVDPSTFQVCAPKADFYPDRQIVCLGDAVQFIDNSTRAEATTWMWNFQDGNPATSNLQSPLVNFTSPGWKQVSLNVSNSEGNDTKTINRSVYISAGIPDYSMPYWESFEWYLPFNEKWIVNNLGENSNAFSLYQGVGYTGNYCIKLGYQNPLPIPFFDGDKDIDELITPSFNLSGSLGTNFNFRYSYATNALQLSNITEKLQVYSSVDCGNTWFLRKTITGTDLASGFGSSGASFMPTSPSQWGYDEIYISGSLAQPDVRFKFVFISSPYSNNLYLDDINIGTSTEVPEFRLNDIDVFPNPVNDFLTIKFNKILPKDLLIELFDITGKKLERITFISESDIFSLDFSQYPSGLYLVRLSFGEQSRCIQIIK